VPEAGSAFGTLLREFRIRAGLSQSELAEKANISEDAIGALERGVRRAPYRSTVALIAKALELDARDSAALEFARVAGRAKSTQTGAKNNLVVERTSFVGREADVKQILKLLERSRLVSVTGSGGVGKTRVALEAARHLFDGPHPEVWFVDFSPLVDGAFVAAKIADAVRPALGDRVDALGELTSALADRHMLLIFDNCEHIVDAIAQAADAILEACPHVSILATSRERLNVAGEFVYRLPSLALPAVTPNSIDEARQFSAIDLFLQRAEAVDPRAAFGAKHLSAVIDVARQLDGIPLAIELTAAQLPAIGIDTLHSRLRRYQGVPSGRRDLPPRQQTVTSTIQWSYDLLAPNEQTLLCRVAIFSGGFTLDAAETVCAGDSLDRPSILELLSSLIDKSLVSVEGETHVRYSLLETVRAFGAERLRESGAHALLARRHAQWLCAIAEENERTGEDVAVQRVAMLVPELDNVRAAVAWSLDAESPDDRATGGTIVSGFFRLWDALGRGQEHRRWVERALKAVDSERHPLAAANLHRDLITLGLFEPNCLDIVRRAIPLGERSGDPLALAKLHSIAAQAYAFHEMFEEAERSTDIAAGLLAGLPGDHSVYYVGLLFSRSAIRLKQGRSDDARAALAEAERLAMGFNDRSYGLCMCYLRRSEIDYRAGDKLTAVDYLQRILDSEMESDERVGRQARLGVANLRLQMGDVAGALIPLRQVLAQEHGNENETHATLEYSAFALALLGNAVLAAKLQSCARVLKERSGLARSPIRQAAYEMLDATLHGLLDERALDVAAASGALITANDAIALALSALPEA
jgi:predicted ATPase/DNA-binding XRE family transcriptional regulator